MTLYSSNENKEAIQYVKDLIEKYQNLLGVDFDIELHVETNHYRSFGFHLRFKVSEASIKFVKELLNSNLNSLVVEFKNGEFLLLCSHTFGNKEKLTKFDIIVLDGRQNLLSLQGIPTYNTLAVFYIARLIGLVK